MVKNFSEFTLDDFIDGVMNLFKPIKQPRFQIIGDGRLYKLININYRQRAGLINTKQAVLETVAVWVNAYIVPTWDYLKYPEIDLYKNKYSNSFTNEQFESVGEDEYGDDILIYTNRIYNYD